MKCPQTAELNEIRAIYVGLYKSSHGSVFSDTQQCSDLISSDVCVVGSGNFK